MNKKEEKTLIEETPESAEVLSDPINITLAKAQNDITMAIVQIQNAYGLPSYLMDLLVSSALGDIRACANKELLNVVNTDNTDKNN